jgi:hypothetical protein
MGPTGIARGALKQAVSDPESKLKAVRRATKHSFPTVDVGQMLEEIERGYRG